MNIPTEVYTDSAVNQAMDTLYFHGVNPADYRRYFARRYELDAIADARTYRSADDTDLPR